MRRSISVVAIVVTALAGASGPCAGEGEAVPRASVDALQGTYAFSQSGAESYGCRVTLNGPTMHDMPSGPWGATINTRCRRIVPALRPLTRWMPTGGASIRLMGGKPERTLGEFSPVQDGTGVYLRGGIGKDGKLYELRPVSDH